MVDKMKIVIGLAIIVGSLAYNTYDMYQYNKAIEARLIKKLIDSANKSLDHYQQAQVYSVFGERGAVF
jgi:uncharacterized membrane protein YebE (DUF533 family)